MHGMCAHLAVRGRLSRVAGMPCWQVHAHRTLTHMPLLETHNGVMSAATPGWVPTGPLMGTVWALPTAGDQPDARKGQVPKGQNLRVGRQPGKGPLR